MKLLHNRTAAGLTLAVAGFLVLLASAPAEAAAPHDARAFAAFLGSVGTLIG
jgi:hypothetical protein